MRSLLALGVAAWLTWPTLETEDATQLVQADRAFCEDTQEDGLDGWLAWFAPDAVVLTADGRTVEGAEAIAAYYRSIGFPPPGFAWTPEAAELAKSGELGYTLGSWELQAADPPPAGAPPPPSGRYLSIWKRQPDGSLRVLVDSGGRPDFRTRLEELDGPPLEWSSRSDRLELAQSGELAFALGSWIARTAQLEKHGRFLTVWKRDEQTTWAVAAAEIGFDL